MIRSLYCRLPGPIVVRVVTLIVLAVAALALLVVTYEWAGAAFFDRRGDRMRVLVLDNYDSFTFNLVQYLGELGADPEVVRNDVLPAERALAEHRPDRLVISPGPGRTEDAGFSIDYVRALGPEIPTLGVCLGHQAIVVAFGGMVGRAPEPRHGKTSQISHDGKGLFAGVENPFVATRYHSLAALEVPDVLEVTARSEDGVVQGVRHRSLPIAGVQFHPESIMTEVGKQLLGNFLQDE